MTKGAVYIVIDFKASDPGDYFDDMVIRDNYYLKLAIKSASSLKRHMPEIPITLFTNLNCEPLKDVPFDNFINIPEPIGDIWVTKFECLLISPYDHTLHMDADTFVCDRLDEVFESLNKYDLASTMSVSWNTRKISGVPNCFPELAFGVFWWRKNNATQEFLNNTTELLKKRKSGCDEPWVRAALYNSDVKFYVLPFEYNCLYTHPIYLFDKVKIMHGHSQSIENDAKIINTKVYDKYPPWKRLLTGTKIFLFKKIKQKQMKIESEIEYGGLGGGISRA